MSQINKKVDVLVETRLSEYSRRREATCQRRFNEQADGSQNAKELQRQ